MVYKKVCENCGKVLNENYKYCPVCGVRIEYEADESGEIQNNEKVIGYNSDSMPGDKCNKVLNTIKDNENDKKNESISEEKNSENNTENANESNFKKKGYRCKLMTFKKSIIAVIALITIFVAAICTVILMCFGIIDGSYVGIVNSNKSQKVIDNYIIVKEYEKAGDYAVMVQGRRSKDAELLIMLVDEIKSIAPKQTFVMIENYYKKTKAGERNAEIEEMYVSAKSYPVLPEVEPVSGTYINSPDIKFAFKDNRVGHSIYYTLDGSSPSEISSLYVNPFSISSDCILKIISVNAAGEKSSIGTYEYKIDSTKYTELQEMYEKAKESCEKYTAGNEIGQCLYETKNDMELLLEKTQKRVEEGNISCDEADGMLHELNNKLFALNSSVLVACDKTKMKAALDNAKAVLNKSKENRLAYAVKSNIDALENKIGDCQTLYDLRNTTQEKADAMQKEIETLTSNLDRNLQTAILNESYKKFVGEYYGYDIETEYYRNTYIEITKIIDGCVWGSISVSGYESLGGNYKKVEGIGDLNGVKISNGKISVPVSGESIVYDGYGYNLISENEYTGDVTISFNVNKNEMKFYISNIGGGKEWSCTPEKD